MSDTFKNKVWYCSKKACGWRGTKELADERKAKNGCTITVCPNCGGEGFYIKDAAKESLPSLLSEKLAMRDALTEILDARAAKLEAEADWYCDTDHINPDFKEALEKASVREFDSFEKAAELIKPWRDRLKETVGDMQQLAQSAPPIPTEIRARMDAEIRARMDADRAIAEEAQTVSQKRL